MESSRQKEEEEAESFAKTNKEDKSGKYEFNQHHQFEKYSRTCINVIQQNLSVHFYESEILISCLPVFKDILTVFFEDDVARQNPLTF